jgi:hypothetical protein
MYVSLLKKKTMAHLKCRIFGPSAPPQRIAGPITHSPHPPHFLQETKQGNRATGGTGVFFLAAPVPTVMSSSNHGHLQIDKT